MWSKYKFYFIGVAILGVVAILFYRRKKKVAEESETETQTDAMINSAQSEESQRNIAKSLAYIQQN